MTDTFLTPPPLVSHTRYGTLHATLPFPLSTEELSNAETALKDLPRDVHSADAFLPLTHPDHFTPWNASAYMNSPGYRAPPETPSQIVVGSAITEIVENTRSPCVTIVHGGKGSGKSTWVPLALLNAHSGARVFLVSPFPASCALVASRIVELTGWTMGVEIGIQTSLIDMEIAPTSRLVICTPEMMVRRLQNGCDPHLINSLLVLDEIQTRHPYLDLLLLLAKQFVHVLNHSVVVMAGPMDASSFISRLRAYMESGTEGSCCVVTVADSPIGGHEVFQESLPTEQANETSEKGLNEDIIRAVHASTPEIWDLERLLGMVTKQDDNTSQLFEERLSSFSNLDADFTTICTEVISPVLTTMHCDLAHDNGGFIVVLPDEASCTLVAEHLQSAYIPASQAPLTVFTLHENSTSEHAQEVANATLPYRQPFATPKSETTTPTPPRPRPVLLSTYATLPTLPILLSPTALLLDTCRRTLHRYDPIEDTESHIPTWITLDQLQASAQTLIASNPRHSNAVSSTASNPHSHPNATSSTSASTPSSETASSAPPFTNTTTSSPSATPSPSSASSAPPFTNTASSATPSSSIPSAPFTSPTTSSSTPSSSTPSSSTPSSSTPSSSSSSPAAAAPPSRPRHLLLLPSPALSATLALESPSHDPIQHTPRLHELILQLYPLTEALRQHSPERVLWQLLRPPGPAAVEAALRGLAQQGLLTPGGAALSPMGRVVAHLGLPVGVARLLVGGLGLGVGRPLLWLAAAAGMPGCEGWRKGGPNRRDGAQPGEGGSMRCDAEVIGGLAQRYLGEMDRVGFCARVGLDAEVMGRITRTASRMERLLQSCGLLGESAGVYVPPLSRSFTGSLGFTGAAHRDREVHSRLVQHAVVSALYPRVCCIERGGSTVFFPHLTTEKREVKVSFDTLAQLSFTDGTVLAYSRKVSHLDSSGTEHITLSGLCEVPLLSLVLCSGSAGVEETPSSELTRGAIKSNSRKPRQCRGWWPSPFDAVDPAVQSVVAPISRHATLSERERETETSPFSSSVKSTCPRNPTVPCYILARTTEKAWIRLDHALLIAVDASALRLLFALRSTLYAAVLHWLAFSRKQAPGSVLPAPLRDVLPWLLFLTHRNPKKLTEYLAEIGFVNSRRLLQDATAPIHIMPRWGSYLLRRKEEKRGEKTEEQKAVDAAESQSQKGEGSAATTRVGSMPEIETDSLSAPFPQLRAKELELIHRTVEILVKKGTKQFEMEFRRRVADNPCFRFLQDHSPAHPHYLTLYAAERRHAEAKMDGGLVYPPVEGGNENHLSGEELPQIQLEYLPPHLAAAFALTAVSSSPAFAHKPMEYNLEGSTLNTVLRYYSVEFSSVRLPNAAVHRALLLPRSFVPIRTAEGRKREVLRAYRTAGLLESDGLTARRAAMRRRGE